MRLNKPTGSNLIKWSMPQTPNGYSSDRTCPRGEMERKICGYIWLPKFVVFKIWGAWNKGQKFCNIILQRVFFDENLWTKIWWVGWWKNSLTNLCLAFKTIKVLHGKAANHFETNSNYPPLKLILLTAIQANFVFLIWL